MFEIKTGYYLELLTRETMKLLGNTKSKITKDGDGENMHNLEVNEIVLIIVILSTTIIIKIQESYIHLFLINHFVNH